MPTLTPTQSYKLAVIWIAMNDNVNDRNPESIENYTTTQLIADVFSVETNNVAVDILNKRIQMFD